MGRGELDVTSSAEAATVVEDDTISYCLVRRACPPCCCGGLDDLSSKGEALKGTDFYGSCAALLC